MGDKIVLLCAIVLAVAYIYLTEQLPTLAFGDPLGPKAFPRILAVGLIIAIIMLAGEIYATKPASGPKDAAPRDRRAHLLVAAVIAATALYFVLFDWLGFVLSSALYLFGMTTYFNRRHAITNALVSVLFPLACYALISRLLGVQLAQGLLPF